MDWEPLNTPKRIEEWAELLYQLHIRRMGARPTVQEKQYIMRGLRALAMRTCAGEDAAFNTVVTLYGDIRQVPVDLKGRGIRDA